MMKKFFVTLGIILIAKFACCVEKHWQVNPHAFEFNMNVTASIYIDNVEQQDEMLEIGVFFGEELRGSAMPRLSPLVNKYIYDLTIYSDVSCELSFRLYNHSTNEVSDLDCEQMLTFVVNGIEGNAFNPYVVSFVTPTPAITFIGSGSWNDMNNWKNQVLPTEDDKVIIDGDAVVVDEVAVNSIVINENKSLTIQDGGILTVVGEITNADVDALIIEDGGQIFQTNDNVAATFKNNIINPSSWNNPVSGWQFISSPMLDAATEGFESTEGDYDLYKFDGSQELQWVNYKKHDDFEEIFVQGRGYIASYETQTTASFQGNLNGATFFEFPIDYDSDNEWANFYVLGNPFTFDMDWDNADYRRIEDGFVTINATDGSYIYNIEGLIKVGEGFMVCTNRSGAYLEYDASTKSRRNKSDYINIIASNSKGSDNVIINNVENENVGFPKLDNINPNIANVYVKKDNKRYGIFNCFDVDEIALHFDAKEMGNYTLTFDVKGNYENLYLIDKMTGKKLNLLLENEYSFIANSNDNTERFILLLTSDTDSVNEDFVFIYNDELLINAEGTIQIIDMMGRVVMTNENHNYNINISNLNDAAYIVRCVNGNEVKTQKIIVL